MKTLEPANHVQPRRILVPVDLSDSSPEAVRAAVFLAGHFQATLAFQHVLRQNRTFSRSADESAPSNRAVVEAEFARLSEGKLPPGVEAERLVTDGVPFDEITKAAEAWRADLIVMAARGRRTLKGVLLGGTAERVVRHAPCPVLVVRGTQGRAGIDTLHEARGCILVPTDFSEPSLAAMKYASTWARHFGVRIMVLFVVPQHLPGEISQIGVVLHEKRAALEAEQKLPAFCRQHFPPDLTVESRVHIGAPEHSICETAREENASLIMMGSHGHNRFKWLMLGSVAERVVRHADCAVLVVR